MGKCTGTCGSTTAKLSFCPCYNFNTLSYTRTVKIAAIRRVFTTKNSSESFCGEGSATDHAGRASPDY